MGRHPQEFGRWASDTIRLDIIKELKVIAAKNGSTLAEEVNRALALGLQAIRHDVKIADAMGDDDEGKGTETERA